MKPVRKEMKLDLPKPKNNTLPIISNNLVGIEEKTSLLREQSSEYINKASNLKSTEFNRNSTLRVNSPRRSSTAPSPRSIELNPCSSDPSPRVKGSSQRSTGSSQRSTGTSQRSTGTSPRSTEPSPRSTEPSPRSTESSPRSTESSPRLLFGLYKSKNRSNRQSESHNQVGNGVYSYQVILNKNICHEALLAIPQNTLKKIAAKSLEEFNKQLGNQDRSLYIRFNDKNEVISNNNVLDELNNLNDVIVIRIGLKVEQYWLGNTILLDKTNILGEGASGKVVIAYKFPDHTQKEDKLNYYDVLKNNMVAVKLYNYRLNNSAEERLVNNLKSVNEYIGLCHTPGKNSKTVLIMRYIDGVDLIKFLYKLDKSKPGWDINSIIGKRYIRPVDRIRLFHEIIRSVNNFHIQGRMIHRDIKPENFIVLKNLLIRLIDFDDGINENEINRTFNGTIGYIAPEMQHGSDPKYDLLLVSINKGGEIDLNQLKEISKRNKRAPVLINYGGQINIYGYSANIWKVTKLDNTVFKGIVFPEAGSIEVMHPHCLTNEMKEEILLKNGHVKIINEPYSKKTDRWATGVTSGEVISGLSYTAELVFKANRNKKGGFVSEVSQKELYQMMPDIFMNSNLCAMPVLPSVVLEIRNLSIVTPEGLFQHNGDQGYECILSADSLNRLKLNQLLQKSKELAYTKRWMNDEFKDISLPALLEMLNQEVTLKNGRIVKKEELCFMSVLPQADLANQHVSIVTPNGLYQLQNNNQYLCIIDLQRMIDLKLRTFTNISNDLASKKIFFKDELTFKQLIELNKEVISNRGHSLMYEYLRDQFERDGILDHWVQQPVNVLYGYILPFLRGVLKEELEILKTNPADVVDEIIYHLYCYPRLVKIIRLYTQYESIKRPDTSEIIEMLKELDMMIIEFNEWSKYYNNQFNLNKSNPESLSVKISISSDLPNPPNPIHEQYLQAREELLSREFEKLFVNYNKTNYSTSDFTLFNTKNNLGVGLSSARDQIDVKGADTRRGS